MDPSVTSRSPCTSTTSPGRSWSVPSAKPPASPRAAAATGTSGSGRGLSRLKFPKALFLGHSHKHPKEKEHSPGYPINGQFHPVDIPSVVAGPRSPVKAWRVLGIPGHSSSPANTLVSSNVKSRPATADGPSPSSTGLRLRPSFARLYTSPSPGQQGPSAGLPMASGTKMGKLSTTADYSIHHSVDPTLNRQISHEDQLFPSTSSHGLLRSTSAHPIRPSRSFLSLATPPNPPRSAPLAATPQIREPVGEPIEYFEIDALPQAALRSALFKASLEASNVSQLDVSAGTTRSPSRASSINEQIWPPVNLVSHFSDATSTAAQSTVSLISTESSKYDPGVGDCQFDLAMSQLSRLDSPQEIVAGSNDAPAKVKVVEWCAQYRNDLRTPHAHPHAPPNMDDVATAMAALRARTPRRSLSLPSLVRSASDESLVSSSFQSPRAVDRPLVQTSREGSGGAAIGEVGGEGRGGGRREGNGTLEVERFGLGLEFEWVKPPVGGSPM